MYSLNLFKHSWNQYVRTHNTISITHHVILIHVKAAVNSGNDSLVSCTYPRTDCYLSLKKTLSWHSGLACCRYVAFTEKYGWHAVDPQCLNSKKWWYPRSTIFRNSRRVIKENFGAKIAACVQHVYTSKLIVQRIWCHRVFQ